MPAWIGVDWGTSNCRAWGIDEFGQIMFEADAAIGMGRLSPQKFSPELKQLLTPYLEKAPEAPRVVICGMAGARQGWCEARYLETPTDLVSLARKAVSPIEADWAARISILPGLAHRGEPQSVMRGEETQLLGLVQALPNFEGLVAMPGTHGKWVQMSKGRVISFATTMTGEIYNLLSTQSVLRHSVDREGDAVLRATGFQSGAEQGLARPDLLLGQVFNVRAAALLSERSPSWCAGYLSGLLIGSEVGGFARGVVGPLPLICAPELGRLYIEVLELAGIEVKLFPGKEMVLAGLALAHDTLEETE